MGDIGGSHFMAEHIPKDEYFNIYIFQFDLFYLLINSMEIIQVSIPKTIQFSICNILEWVVELHIEFVLVRWYAHCVGYAVATVCDSTSGDDTLYITWGYTLSHGSQVKSCIIRECCIYFLTAANIYIPVIMHHQGI